jgi:hypothetical protein
MSLINKQEVETIENNPFVTENIVNELYDKIKTHWNPIDPSIEPHRESLVIMLSLSILFMDKIMYNLRPSNKKQNGGINEFVKNTDELIKFVNNIENLLYISINFVATSNNNLLTGGTKEKTNGTKEKTNGTKEKTNGGMSLGFTVKDIIIVLFMLCLSYKVLNVIPGVKVGIQQQFDDLKGRVDATVTGKTVVYDEAFKTSLLESDKILVRTIIKPNNGKFYNMYDYVIGTKIDFNEFIQQYEDVCVRWNIVIESGGIPSTSIKAITDGTIPHKKVEDMSLADKTVLFEHLYKNTIDQNPDLRKIITKDMFFRDEYGGCSREGELSPRCIISGFPSSFAEAQSQLLLAQSESFFPSPSLIYNMFTGTNSKASCNINHLIKATYNDKETANELENLIDKLKYKPDFYINMSTTDSVNRNWGSAESPKSMKETIEHLNTLICDYDNIVNTEGQESEAGETARLKVTTFWTSLRKKGIAKLYHSNNSLVQQGIRAIAGQDQKRRDELLKEHDTAYANLNSFLDIIEKESKILPTTRAAGGKRKKTRKLKKSKKARKTKSKKPKNKKTKKQSKKYKRKMKRNTRKKIN